MPGAPRPNKQLAKLAYKILKTPKDQQQYRDDKPTKRQLNAWWTDSTISQ